MSYRIRRRTALRLGGLGGAAAFSLAALGCGGSEKKTSTEGTTGAGAAQATTAPGGAAAAAGAPKQGGILTTGSTIYRSWDPHQETFNNVINSVGPAYDNLLQYEPTDPFDSKIIAALAEKWEQPDPQSVVLSLRSGVKWHDGKDFNAEDAVFSLKRIADPPQGVVGPRKSWLAAMDSVTAPDARTVKIGLKRPQASFLSFLGAGWMMMLPKHVLEPNQEALKRTVMGTGPFMADQLDFNVQVTLKRNPDYWDKGKPYVDGIKYLVLTPEATVPAYRSQRIDWFPIGNDNLEQLKGELPKDRLASHPSFLHFHLMLNMKKKPFDDVRVRQAISYAIDRDEIIGGIDFGRGVVSSPMPATGNWDITEKDLRKRPGYSNDAKQRDADRAEAKKLLAAAGHANGFSATMTLGEGPQFDQGGQIAAEQLKAIGVNLTTKVEEFTTLLNKRDQGDFDTIAYELGVSLDDPDDALVVQFLTGAGRNYVGYSDPDVDRLIAQQSVTLDRTKRKDIVLNINKILLDNVTLVFIHWPLQNWTWQSYVKGFASKSSLYSNYRQTTVWMDKK